MRTAKSYHLYIVFIFAFASSPTSAFCQVTDIVAACCEGKTGRCTGSAHCTACTNCKYCKYCNNGGSCGICAGRNRKTTTRTYQPEWTRNSSTSKSSSTGTKSRSIAGGNLYAESGIYVMPDDKYSEYYQKTLIVNAETLNLRTGPGTEYAIRDRLYKYQALTFLAMKENWIKVEIQSNHSIGYVHYNYVLLLVD